MSVLTEIIEDSMRHFSELVIAERMEVVMLTGVVTFDSDEDIYYVMYTQNGRHLLSSCVGGFTPLRGYTRIHDYERMMRIWGYNTPIYKSLREMMAVPSHIRDIYEVNPETTNSMLMQFRQERSVKHPEQNQPECTGTL